MSTKFTLTTQFLSQSLNQAPLLRHRLQAKSLKLSAFLSVTADFLNNTVTRRVISPHSAIPYKCCKRRRTFAANLTQSQAGSTMARDKQTKAGSAAKLNVKVPPGTPRTPPSSATPAEDQRSAKRIKTENPGSPTEGKATKSKQNRIE